MHLLLFANGWELANKSSGDLQKYIATFNFAHLTSSCTWWIIHDSPYSPHIYTGQVVVSIQMIILLKVQQIIMTTVTCYVIGNIVATKNDVQNF